jgi:dihydroflavonol-4-reductase
MGRLAVITGATGFVGSHLAERLVTDGWEVRALVRSSSDTTLLRSLGTELYEGDLTDPASIARAIAGADAVFHLAALTAARDEAGYHRANVEGTRAVVRALAGADPRPPRLVYLSSYAACGPAANGGPRALAEEPAPLTAYGRTKLAGEAEAGRAAEGGTTTVVVRSPAVYGPRDRALLPYFRLVRWGVAPLPGDGERRLHMVYAPDLALALARAADAPEGTYAVAEPVEHTWEGMVGSIARSMQRRPLKLPLPTPLVRLAARVTEQIASVAGTTVLFNREKAEEMLARAWVCDLSGSEILLSAEEATPLDRGMAHTVQWYKCQGWL